MITFWVVLWHPADICEPNRIRLILAIVFQPQPAVNPSDLEPPNYTEIKEELTEFYDEFCAWSDILYIDEPLLYQNVVSALETLIDTIVQ